MSDSDVPVRPQREPKPLLDEDIASVLARLDDWYDGHLPSQEFRLNSPATEMQLDAFETLVGIEMPRAFRQLYGWHDGEADEVSGHIFGLTLLSLSQAGEQWASWSEVLEGFDGNRYAIPGGSWPPGAVDPAYINPRWIPLTHDAGGNHIGLDFDPWPEGRIGQIILYGRDEDVKAVLAPSLGEFLRLIAELLESGNFRVEADPEDSGRHQFLLKNPPVEHFHDGIRQLVGAAGPYLP